MSEQLWILDLRRWGLAIAILSLLGNSATGQCGCARNHFYPLYPTVEIDSPILVDAVVHFRVRLPADAELWINGGKTSQKGILRRFVSQSLDPCWTYAFTFRARWRTDSEEIEQTRNVVAQVGNDLIVDLTRGDTKAPVKPRVLDEFSLYDRLGGETLIKAVVDDVVARALADPKVNFTRKGTTREWKATPDNIARLKTHLVQLIAAASGGPQKYEGRNMQAVHKGMKITGAEFDAFAADLEASLDRLKVPPRERDKLLKIIAAMRKDIAGQ
jgi:hemoglobin